MKENFCKKVVSVEMHKPLFLKNQVAKKEMNTSCEMFSNNFFQSSQWNVVGFCVQLFWRRDFQTSSFLTFNKNKFAMLRVLCSCGFLHSTETLAPFSALNSFSSLVALRILFLTVVVGVVHSHSWAIQKPRNEIKRAGQ